MQKVIRNVMAQKLPKKRRKCCQLFMAMVADGYARSLVCSAQLEFEKQGRKILAVGR
jgi:hypothetical protein